MCYIYIKIEGEVKKISYFVHVILICRRSQLAGWQKEKKTSNVKGGYAL